MIAKIVFLPGSIHPRVLGRINSVALEMNVPHSWPDKATVITSPIGIPAS